MSSNYPSLEGEWVIITHSQDEDHSCLASFRQTDRSISVKHQGQRNMVSLAESKVTRYLYWLSYSCQRKNEALVVTFWEGRAGLKVRSPLNCRLRYCGI